MKPKPVKLKDQLQEIANRIAAHLKSFESDKTINAPIPHYNTFGADRLTETEDARAWLQKWLPLCTRKVRHPGCHKYLMGMTRTTRRLIARSSIPAQPYPKMEAA